MSGWKQRQRVVGAGGFIFGSACLNCPSAIADAVVVAASLAVTGIGNGDELFVQAATGLPAGMVLLSASAVAGGISASFINSGSADSSASADVTVNYLALPG